MEILFQKIERNENVTAGDFLHPAKVLADYMRDFPREWVVDCKCNMDAESDGRCLDIMLIQGLRQYGFSGDNDSCVHRKTATEEIPSLGADGKVQVDHQESTWNYLAGEYKWHCFHKLTKRGLGCIDSMESNPTETMGLLACEIGIYCVRILASNKLWSPDFPSSTLPERMESLVKQINRTLESKATSEAMAETEAATLDAGDNEKAKKGKAKPAKDGRTPEERNAAVRDYLRPNATRNKKVTSKEIAESIGASGRAVKNTKAWRAYQDEWASQHGKCSTRDGKGRRPFVQEVELERLTTEQASDKQRDKKKRPTKQYERM